MDCDLTRRLRAVCGQIEASSLGRSRGGRDFVTNLYDDSPRKKRTRFLLNEYEAERDPLAKELLARRLRTYQRELTRDHEFHESWELAVMNACIEASVGTLGAALAADLRCLELASEPWQRVVSLANSAESLRRLGRFTDAMEYAVAALELDPTYTAAIAGLLLTFLKGGAFEQASALIDAYPLDLLGRESDVLRQDLRFQPDYRDYREQVPELARRLDLVQQEV